MKHSTSDKGTSGIGKGNMKPSALKAGMASSMGSKPAKVGMAGSKMGKGKC